MSKALYFYGGSEDAFETAYFIGKMDKFFDVFNVSSFSEGKLKRKVFQQPYRSPIDGMVHYMYAQALVLTTLLVSSRATPVPQILAEICK